LSVLLKQKIKYFQNSVLAMLCARQEKGRKPMVKKTAKDSREIEEGTICCGNIWEAAFLIYQKIPFTKTEICNGKVTFVFSDTPEAQCFTGFHTEPRGEASGVYRYFSEGQELCLSTERTGKSKWKTGVG